MFAAEAQISQQKLDMLAFEQVHRAGDVARHVHIVVVLQQTPEPVACMLLIINNENDRLERVHGGVMLNAWMLDARFIIEYQVSRIQCLPDLNVEPIFRCYRPFVSRTVSPAPARPRPDRPSDS